MIFMNLFGVIMGFKDLYITQLAKLVEAYEVRPKERY